MVRPWASVRGLEASNQGLMTRGNILRGMLKFSFATFDGNTLEYLKKSNPTNPVCGLGFWYSVYSPDSSAKQLNWEYSNPANILDIQHTHTPITPKQFKMPPACTDF